MKKIFMLAFILFSFSVAKAQQDSLQEYTGKYKFPAGSVVSEVRVTLENGVLTGSSDMGSSEFRRIKGDEFEIVAYAGVATFKRNSDGKITGIRILVSDVDLEGTRAEGLSWERLREL